MSQADREREARARAARKARASGKVKCSACKATMPRPDWDVHACPAGSKPLPGETFEVYSERAEKIAAEWRRANGIPD